MTNSYPTANAGTDIKVLLPTTSTTLDGSASTESAGKALTYKWTQNYGPSVIQFSSSTIANPGISGLVEGIYSLKLTVTNTDARIDEDEVLVNVSSSANIAPTVAIISPENNSTYTQGKAVTISANANDFDGTITKVEFYHGATLIESDDTAPFSIVWNPAIGDYALTAKATDNGGATSTSQAVNVKIDPSMLCVTTSTQASEGSFTLGYIASFETVGSNVTMTFELLDDKAGVIAYAFKKSPFSETAMTNVGGKKFSFTLGGLTAGQTISYACKFAFGGGMAVTKYFDYVVGTSCGSPINDTQAPTAFSATKGVVGSASVELLLTATDNSGAVSYTIKYGTTTLTTTGTSAVQKSYIVSGLTPETAYNFSVEAKDAAGNAAANNPIVVSATTTKESVFAPAPTPSLLASNVISVFSDPYTNVATNFDMWYATAMTEITSGTDKIKLVNSTSANAAFGTPEITPNLNLVSSSMEKLHADIYPTVATTMSLGIVTSTGECKLPLTLIPGQWNSIDLLLTSLKANNPAIDLTKVKQVGFWLVNGNFYMDNLFFYKGNYETLSAVTDIRIETFVSLYPNPVQDKLRVSSEQIISQLIVRNLVGQAIQLVKVNNTETILDLSQLTAGNYLVSFKMADGRFTTRKIVKQ